MNLALWGVVCAICLSCLATWYLTVSVMVRNRERADRARATAARERAATHIGDWAYPQPCERRRPAHAKFYDQAPLPGTWAAPPDEGSGAAIPADKWPTTTEGAYVER